MKPKVLIAEKVHQVLISQLEKMGFECNISSSINQVEMLAIIENYDGIIVRGKLELDKVFFEKQKK
jgi:D-3-phosphoglycerate dehydrogenase